MKIMFLVGSYWPSQDGVAHVTRYLAEGLAKKHEVCLLTSYGKSVEKHERFNSVDIERIDARRRHSCKVTGDKADVLKKIQEYRPDVLIVVGIQNWGFDWTKGKLDKLPGEKVLMTHGSSCLGEYNIWNKIRKIKFRKEIFADLLGVYIEWYWKHYQKSFPKYMAKYDLITYLFDKEPLYLYMRRFSMKKEIILENATEDFFFERKAYLIQNEKPIVFINVSNYEDRKNQKLILEAYYEADLSGSRLILIGSKKNEYYQELLKENETFAETDHRCQKADIFAGLKREEVLNLYKEADIYLSASRWEAMSISICEAAAAGLTIISTDAGHVSDIPGVYLFHTKKELVEIMGKVYENPGLRAENGKKAYEYAVDKYRIQSKVDYLEQVLLNL